MGNQGLWRECSHPRPLPRHLKEPGHSKLMLKCWFIYTTLLKASRNSLSPHRRLPLRIFCSGELIPTHSYYISSSLQPLHLWLPGPSCLEFPPSIPSAHRNASSMASSSPTAHEASRIPRILRASSLLCSYLQSLCCKSQCLIIHRHTLVSRVSSQLVWGQKSRVLCSCICHRIWNGAGNTQRWWTHLAGWWKREASLGFGCSTSKASVKWTNCRPESQIDLSLLYYLFFLP